MFSEAFGGGARAVGELRSAAVSSPGVGVVIGDGVAVGVGVGWVERVAVSLLGSGEMGVVRTSVAGKSSPVFGGGGVEVAPGGGGGGVDVSPVAASLLGEGEGEGEGEAAVSGDVCCCLEDSSWSGGRGTSSMLEGNLAVGDGETVVSGEAVVSSGVEAISGEGCDRLSRVSITVAVTPAVTTSKAAICAHWGMFFSLVG